MATNKTLLAKGIRNLGFLVLLFILSPIALTISYKALDTFTEANLYWAYAFIGLSGVLIIFTLVFAFKTFQILLNALFDS